MTAADGSGHCFLDDIQLGLGAWAWGDRIIWQYGRGYTDADIREAFRASLSEDVHFVDTAEVYGSGRSERLLGQIAKELDEPLQVATKFFPWPWRVGRQSTVAALKRSLERLQLQSIALYQIHRPTPLATTESMMEGMVACVEAGLTRQVGVCNFDEAHMLRAYSALARNKIALASNQVHYSLLRHGPDHDRLLSRCKELGIRLIAYSPLEMGLLTGKYGPLHPPPGNRGIRYARLLAALPPLLKLMTQIGQDHGGKSNAQVALNWVIAKGALPIPGAKNAEQALDNAGGKGWFLSDDEVAALEAASRSVA